MLERGGQPMDKASERIQGEGACPFLCGRPSELKEGEGNKERVEREEFGLHGEHCSGGEILQETRSPAKDQGRPEVLRKSSGPSVVDSSGVSLGEGGSVLGHSKSSFES